MKSLYLCKSDNTKKTAWGREYVRIDFRPKMEIEVGTPYMSSVGVINVYIDGYRRIGVKLSVPHMRLSSEVDWMPGGWILV